MRDSLLFFLDSFYTHSEAPLTHEYCIDSWSLSIESGHAGSHQTEREPNIRTQVYFLLPQKKREKIKLRLNKSLFLLNHPNREYPILFFFCYSTPTKHREKELNEMKTPLVHIMGLLYRYPLVTSFSLFPLPFWVLLPETDSIILCCDFFCRERDEFERFALESPKVIASAWTLVSQSHKSKTHKSKIHPKSSPIMPSPNPQTPSNSIFNCCSNFFWRCRLVLLVVANVLIIRFMFRWGLLFCFVIPSNGISLPLYRSGSYNPRPGHWTLNIEYWIFEPPLHNPHLSKIHPSTHP